MKNATISSEVLDTALAKQKVEFEKELLDLSNQVKTVQEEKEQLLTEAEIDKQVMNEQEKAIKTLKNEKLYDITFMVHKALSTFFIGHIKLHICLIDA